MKAVRYSDSPATCATTKFLPYIRTPEKSYVYSVRKLGINLRDCDSEQVL